jgi:hypothetical protein
MLGADVLTLGMAADETRRDTLQTSVVTYLRVHPVDASEADTVSEVPEAAAEIRVHSLPDTLDVAVESIRSLKAIAGRRRVVGFSWTDLVERGWSDGSALKQLVDAGLADVAELPLDRIDDIDTAIAALVRAGAVPRRLTVSQPVGDARVDIISRAQRLFDAHASLRRFSPLPRVAPVDKPTTGYDDVRMVAMARLALPHRSIEVDWQLYGPKLAQVALTFGADHLDAVSATEDLSLGPRRGAVEDVERNIRAAGFEPRAVTPDQS